LYCIVRTAAAGTGTDNPREHGGIAAPAVSQREDATNARETNDGREIEPEGGSSEQTTADTGDYDRNTAVTEVSQTSTRRPTATASDGRTDADVPINHAGHSKAADAAAARISDGEDEELLVLSVPTDQNDDDNASTARSSTHPGTYFILFYMKSYTKYT